MTFGLNRDAMRERRVSAPEIIRAISGTGQGYREVRSSDSSLRVFESEPTKTLLRGRPYLQQFREEIRALNCFTALDSGELSYLLSIQRHFPLRLSQLMVIYAVLFWLGSLVRYDPHSVVALQDSRYWSLIDGFLSQSRPWLLELFEWQFYQFETVLVGAR